ncbi:MAG: glycosyltransferase [Chloroflexi bacterium]|nr:glycosyltransferase [Chloroflexota bacterium]MCI0647389.1 glycosyltransferase [Chloroflexota bacterium]
MIARQQPHTRVDRRQKWRIAIVVQRYGEEVGGGAELHARWLAERLLSIAEVEVMTTCALDYRTWANHYPAGDSTLNGVKLHRFPVDAPRNWPKAQGMTVRLILHQHSVLDELEWIRQQGPVSTPLLNAIAGSRDDYDAFIFFTYSYATTFFGLPLVADKALLVPTAHDEPYLRLALFRPLFQLPQVIIYNTETEKRLVNQITRNNRPAQIVAGVGINVPTERSEARFRQQFGIQDPFVLYVGRVDEAKNVPELLEQFIRFRQEYADPLKLVLIGRSHIRMPNHPDVIHLDFQPEEVKFDALEAANVIIVPSLYESLSMITLEAWWLQKPVLVNGRCQVLQEQCRRSNGGLYYCSYQEFALTFHKLLASSELGHQLGIQGHRFVARNYHWDVVMAKYRTIFETIFDSQGGSRGVPALA